jgi:polyhydroxyalkanoate synthesis repressor PhaR
MSRRTPKAATPGTPPEPADSVPGPRVLKKYPNRRLYDTRTSSYITLGDVKQMVMAGEAFEVRDAKTGEDLTRSILLQIILEEEAGGYPMFSTAMLVLLIRFYGHAMQGLMGSYLEANLRQFVELQGRMVGTGGNLFDPAAYQPERWQQVLTPPSGAVPELWTQLLEQNRSTMTTLQDQWQEQWKQALTGLFPGFPPKA